MPSGSGKGDILIARAAVDSFADRYSAFESVAPRPGRQTAGDRTGTISSSYKLAEAMPGLPFAERYPTADIFAPTFVFKRPAERAHAGAPAAPYKLASLSPEVPYGRPVVKQAHTDLIGFDNSAFPYFGRNPRTGERFSQGGRYSDNRVLVHVPAGFDVRKPGVIVLFFHGHGATLQRDVRDRQLLPLQISESGMNAVLVAPQLAYDAADSSAGKFWEPGGLKRFMAEAADRLARIYGDPRASEAFARMPVVIVAYSGGFVSAASCLQVGGLGSRIRGVVLLDALYGEMDKFTSWIVNNRSAFFVSAYTQYTRHRDDELARILRDKGVAVSHDLNGPLQPGTVAFLATEGVRHRDYVTLAWTEHPVKDILQRMPRR
ncbi:MAG TPA: alpha/beta hydrolase [Xanthobacteraceae bacterium]